MKQILLLKKCFILLVLHLSCAAYAQVYEPAFIISMYGDTIRCQFKHIRFISSKTEFRYKKSLEDDKDLFINSQDVLWVMTTKDTFECLKVDKGLYKGQVYAYKLLSNGHLRLYSQEHFTKMGGEAAAAFFLKKENKPLQEIGSLDYKKHLAAYTSDDAATKDKLEKLLFKEENLKEFVHSYNQMHNKLEK